MFQLLQSIWLYALAGLAVPVVIHLWNQRPGKTLRVGSISLVTENKVSRRKNIHLTELLLLLLRCLLLAAIVFALAGLQWRSNDNNVSKGWVLMPRSQLKTTYQHFKSTIDSLLKTGMEFHYFEDGFPKENVDKALIADDTVKAPLLYYRSIVSSLNETLDANTPVYIFTDNYLRNFSGQRNPVSLNLHWLGFTPNSSIVKPDSDTNTITISIYQKGYASDAKYITAAIEAIKQFSKRNMRIVNVATTAALPAQQDWLFWLSEKPLPQNIKSNNILQYAERKATTCNSYLIEAEGASFDPLHVYKAIKETDSINSPAIKWRDGFGEPILTLSTANNSNRYTLFTHVDPAWSELPWNPAFPQMLYELMYSSSVKTITDNTIIDSSQMSPIIIPAKTSGQKQSLFKTISLIDVCWLLAFIFFIAERTLSYYQSKTSAYD